jgi:hypothetical protein
MEYAGTIVILVDGMRRLHLKVRPQTENRR